MKGVIKTVIAGSIIIGIGIIVLLITLAVNGWSFKQPEFEMQPYTAENEISVLDLKLGAGSLKIEFYDGDKVTVDYPVSSATKNEIKENNGVLIFSTRTKHIINFGKLNIPVTTVKVPEGSVIDLKLEIDAGTANIPDGTYGKIDVDIDAGTVNLGGGTCNIISLDIDAGSLNADKINCNKLECDMDAGSCKIENLTCPDTRVDVDAGSANITFTGKQSEYTISRKVSAGSCNVGAQSGDTDKRINVDVSAGSVKLFFAD